MTKEESLMMIFKLSSRVKEAIIVLLESESPLELAEEIRRFNNEKESK